MFKSFDSTNSRNFFLGEISFLVKNSYLLTSPDDEAEILAICLSKLN